MRLTTQCNTDSLPHAASRWAQLLARQRNFAPLRASKRFLEHGQGFKAGNGEGRQRKYSCSGAPAVAKKSKPGDPSQVRATKLRPSEWHATKKQIMYQVCYFSWPK